MAFLTKRGITLMSPEERNMFFVTRRIEVDYVHELLVDDQIKIFTKIDHIGRTSVVFLQSIVCEKIGTTTTCKSVFVLLDSTTRLKMDIPEELCIKLLSEYLA